MTGGVTFGPEGVHFDRYPYAPAGVPPSGDVALAAIRDADPTSAPPEIRLRSGETVFVAAARRADLAAFCEQHRIPLLRRPDVWGALLEPFLDTQFTEADEQRTGARLLGAGFTADDTAAIRARFTDVMVAYNFESMLWDWFHLGLSDLLEALSGNLSGERHRLAPDEFHTAYWWAMDVADRTAGQSEPVDYDQNSSQA